MSTFVRFWSCRSIKRITSPVYGNPNMPEDYSWLDGELKCVAENCADTLGCKDTSTGEACTPLFFVMGACPSTFTSMQALMFVVSAGQQVRFWWVKPRGGEASAGEVERETLNCNVDGPHKNDPGQSKAVYQPLADCFQMSTCHGCWRFGIESPREDTAREARRAYIEQVVEGTLDGSTERLYVQAVWQEDWTANPFAWSKYIKGKLVYQKDPAKSAFHFREYMIVDGKVSIAAEETESPFVSLTRDDAVKRLVYYP